MAKRQAIQSTAIHPSALRSIPSGKGGTHGDESQASLAELAYKRLYKAIEDKVFQPGMRLVEREVAERLNISRTPVREALRRLEADGLVHIAPPRGIVISHLDHQMISELYVTREALEGTAAALAARAASEAEIDFFRALRHQK